MTNWLALVVCVLANVSANIALKGVMVSGPRELSVAALLKYASQPGLWIGFICAGVVLLSYLYAIRVVPLGVAYPFVTSLAMVGVASAGAAFFGEPLSWRHIAGIALIICGVSLLPRT